MLCCVNEMHEAFLYNMRVRFALGYDQFVIGNFELRMLYYFHERVSRYMQETGIILLVKAFEKVTDQQIMAYQLNSSKQSMDSTQIASNFRTK